VTEQPNNPPADNQTTPPDAEPLAPWFAKTPAPRPKQADITVNPDQIINRQGKDFVLYAGLLDAAHRAGLQGISTSLVKYPGTGSEGAIVHATAHFPWGSFDGIGDADPSNVSRNIAPHLTRMAETRAKARALRDALNIGMVAMEEMGGDDPDYNKAAHPVQQNRLGNGSSGAAPRPVQRPDGGSSVTSSPGTRKSYGTPMTKGPVTSPGRSTSWPNGE
jgi:hypothetical protein